MGTGDHGQKRLFTFSNIKHMGMLERMPVTISEAYKYHVEATLYNKRKKMKTSGDLAHFLICKKMRRVYLMPL
eukprot:15365220-Ditylum_brightwellii.AAC.1